MKNRMHFFDYQMYENGFGSQEMRDLWSERGILQQWVDFEVYLAQAPGRARNDPTESR